MKDDQDKSSIMFLALQIIAKTDNVEGAYARLALSQIKAITDDDEPWPDVGRRSDDTPMKRGGL